MSDRLPVDPLSTWVEPRGVAELFDKGSALARAYHRACDEGTLTLDAADKLCDHLGMHPSNIWGADYFDATPDADIDLDEIGPGRTCELDGCDRPHCARGWCRRHYLRWWRDGDPGPARIPKLNRKPWLRERAPGERGCDVNGCDRPHAAKGWCSMHYDRVRRDGEPGPAEPMEARRPKIRHGCQVPGCRRKHRARGLCSSHAKHLYRDDGDPDVIACALPSTHDRDDETEAA